MALPSPLQSAIAAKPPLPAVFRTPPPSRLNLPSARAHSDPGSPESMHSIDPEEGAENDSDNVQVYVRVRPCNSTEIEAAGADDGRGPCRAAIAVGPQLTSMQELHVAIARGMARTPELPMANEPQPNSHAVPVSCETTLPSRPAGSTQGGSTALFVNPPSCPAGATQGGSAVPCVQVIGESSIVASVPGKEPKRFTYDKVLTDAASQLELFEGMDGLGSERIESLTSLPPKLCRDGSRLLQVACSSISPLIACPAAAIKSAMCS